MAYCQPSGVCLTQFCLLTKAITRGWHWENTYQVQNKSALCLINYKTQQFPNTSTYKAINSKTHQLTTSSTHNLINSQTYHLTNLSTHKPITSQTYHLTNSSSHNLTNSSPTPEHINLQTQKLKLFVLFLQNRSEFHAVLARI